MKILFIGDISGKPGRETVKACLPRIKQDFAVDFVIANAENSSHGKGIIREQLNELQSYGVDFFTSGDHLWDQKIFISDLYDENLPLIRFYNYEGGQSIPGKTMEIIEIGGKKIVVASFQGMSFMRFHVKNTFWAADDFIKELEAKGINKSNSIIIIDIHAESTAEKLCFGEYLKESVSAVLGTHTHVGTSDARVLSSGTAYITDVGMVGPLEASLWAKYEDAIHNFKYPYRRMINMEEEGKRTFNSVLMEFDDNNMATSIQRIDRIL